MTRIALIHTNDLHSRFDQWPYTAAVIKAERARMEAQGIPAVYVDAGDFLDMSHQLTYLSGGQVAIDLLAAADCRAQTMGNNELWRAPVAQITGLAARAPFPWLAANLRDADGRPLPDIRDWAVVEVGPVKVGLIGLSEPYPHFAAGMNLTLPPILAAASAATAACRTAGADIVVHLSHLGSGIDPEVLAENPGIDAVVGGHNHQLITPPEVLAGVPMVQAGDLGQHVGTFLLDVDLERRCLTGWDGYLTKVDPAGVEPDPEALTILARHQAAADAVLAEVVAVLPEALPHEPSGPSALGRLLAEVLRRRAGADIGMAVGAQLASGLPAGPVTRRQVMESMQSLFLPSLLEVPGQSLKAMLEESHDGETAGKRCGVGGQRPYGQLIGQIHMAGVSYQIDSSRVAGDRVQDLRVNGQPVDPDRTYLAGGLSLMAYPEAGYASFRGNRLIRRYMPEQCHELVLAALVEGLLTPP